MDFFKKEEINQLKEENALLKLKIKELEEQVSSQKSVIEGYKAKEESISDAIVFAVERSNQLEASRKKLYQLDIQRSRLLYLRMEQVLNELYNRYPELKKDAKLTDMSEKFKQAVYSQAELQVSEPNYSSSGVKEDPIRKLLNNIVNYIDDKKEIKTIKRTQPTPKQPQPNFDFYQNPLTAYTNSPQTSGFNINEALHPSESLEDILKAFDLGKKSKK
ncbi:MAG: hypothetical protein IJX26_04310 [Clostridia bacterium]|nr:hypothetical protein [Clostridia bacterium]